ncbi:recombinase family protein [Corynebacterium singulare]|uniref:Site-specific recombinase, DNA invertase Pin n=1 Tax=Corynebacterium singulare TaxID=161899 RepID=A0A0B6F220_9CORY|nr:recombinase family protein [Corynebacterium singulare]AJI78500.1 site-specific recombinase, DNA invertase Pin [Corynebacterium singulare]
MRVLARTRISRSTEESTSIARQRELIENWAQENDHEIVAWAEDLDVSGSISPFDALELGPYLKEPLSAEWEILVAWKLDRLARNSINTHKLFAWIIEQDKTLVCISENIDLGTWVGRMVASAISGVAEGELEAIRERTKATKEKMRRDGKWFGGKPPYGYVPVKYLEGWKLEKEPEEQEVVQKIFGMALDGVSAWAIAKWLNNEKIPTATESRWRKKTQGWQGETVRQMLRNKAYLGWTTHEKSLVLDAVGNPVEKCEPSISAKDFNRIQELLRSRSNRPTGGDTSPLLGVLKCWDCGQNMHIRRQKMAGGKVNEAYYCPQEHLPHAVSGEPVKQRVYELFEQELGDHEIMEHRIISGRDTSEELAEANQAYEELSGYLSSALNKNARRLLHQQLNQISERIKNLESIPDKTVREWVSTGRRYIDEWNELNEEGKRLLMLRHEVSVRVRQLTKSSWKTPGILETEFCIPQQLKDRLQT